MKRTTISIIFAILSLLLFTSCDASIGPGASDWSYDLPNQYQIIRANSHSISIGYGSTSGTITTREDDKIYGVDAYVWEFCVNSRYVGVKQVDVPENARDEVRFLNPRYYLIDTLKQNVYGPFKEAEYDKECKKRSVSGMGNWQTTNPAPEGANYE